MTTKKADKGMKGWWRWDWRELPGSLLFGIGEVFIGIVLAGMVLYIVSIYKSGNSQPFELAGIAGLLGGFPLVAAFSEKVGEGLNLKKPLLVIGGLYLLAAVLFVVFGFYQASDQAGLAPSTGAGVWMFKTIYVVMFYGGALALVFGMWRTIVLIPKLMGLGGFKAELKNMFKPKNTEQDYQSK